MKSYSLIVLVSILHFISIALHAQMTDTKILGMEDARRMADAAHAHAQQNKWNVAIAVVDAGGHLIFFQKMDGTQLASIEIAIKKAKTAVFYKRPSKAFEESVARGNLVLLGLPDMLPFEGGLPVEYNGIVIGAIGVSGVTAEQDGIIAKAALNAL